MQEELQKLNDINRGLQKDIRWQLSQFHIEVLTVSESSMVYEFYSDFVWTVGRRRMGDCLEDLTYHELSSLKEEMVNSVKVIRERKV